MLNVEKHSMLTDKTLLLISSLTNRKFRFNEHSRILVWRVKMINCCKSLSIVSEC